MSPTLAVCSLCLLLLASGQQQAVATDDESAASLGATLESLRVFNTFLGGDKEGFKDQRQCQFRCRNGAQPRPRSGYRPTFNGCGSREFRVDTSSLPAVTECCNRHDICYGTCNSAKSDCETQFAACLTEACNSMRSAGTLADARSYGKCKSIASLFQETVQTFGCEFYLDAQASACQCVLDDDKGE